MTVEAGSVWISGSHLVSLQDTHFTFEHQVETQLFIMQKNEHYSLCLLPGPAYTNNILDS